MLVHIRFCCQRSYDKILFLELFDGVGAGRRLELSLKRSWTCSIIPFSVTKPREIRPLAWGHPAGKWKSQVQAQACLTSKAVRSLCTPFLALCWTCSSASEVYEVHDNSPALHSSLPLPSPSLRASPCFLLGPPPLPFWNHDCSGVLCSQWSRWMNFLAEAMRQCYPSDLGWFLCAFRT